jgi:PAS domain S-box-containing protein
MSLLFPTWLLTSAPLTPHGFCLLWQPWLIWSFVIGDAGTGLAYFAIPLALARFVRRRRDLVFKPVFLLFAAFILLCGATHWLELLTIWVPAYGLEAVSKLLTAAVSIATTVALWRFMPQALALPSPSQMRLAHDALKASEGRLRVLNQSLEARAVERSEELRVNQDHLADVLATLNMGTFMTRDFDGTIRFWSDGCARLYGFTAEEALGRNAHDLLRTVFPVSLADLEATLDREGTWTGDLHHHTRDGQEVIATAYKVVRRDAAGRVVVVLEALTDVTAARRGAQERLRADALVRGLVAAAPGLLFAKDRRGRMLLANGAVTALIGKPWMEMKGRTDREFLSDKAQAEAVMANDRKVMDEGLDVEFAEFEELVSGADGQPRVWLSRKTPMRSLDGRVEGLVGMSVDITERKRTEEHLRLMLHELNHRVKNTLATVQSVAWQTLRTVDPAVRESLNSRIGALAAAHDILTRAAWHSADIDDVVKTALAPYDGRFGHRFSVVGPPLRLLPGPALALALALQELCTNALKYGALSAGAENGRVEVHWQVLEGWLHFVWRERDGPPVVTPSHEGFGTRLIERLLAQDLRGTAQIVFDPAGVTCTIKALLVEVAAHEAEKALPQVGEVA